MSKLAIIYNLSGHPVPQSVFEALKAKGQTKYRIFSQLVSIDFHQPVEPQMEKFFTELSEQETGGGHKPFDGRGHRYVVLPAMNLLAVLCVECLASLLGEAPTILVLKFKDSIREFELSQEVDLWKWRKRWRSEMRGKLLPRLRPQEGELV